MNAIGKTVRLFLADGTPGGLQTAEIINWTGLILTTHRTALGALVKRTDVKSTGVYLLIGEDPDALGGLKTYIGEADDVARRLIQHARPEENGGKDFWEHVVVITSKDSNLTKAHATFIESRLIDLARRAKRSTVTNGTKGFSTNLPVSDISDMEYFIEQVLIVLPVLGFDFLRATRPGGPTTSTAADAGIDDPKSSPLFRISSTHTDATAQEVDGEFIVREDSLARESWIGVETSYKKLRDAHESNGDLELTIDGNHMRFTRDVVFASVSAAAAVVLGRNANGRTEWKVENSQVTYAAWQESLVGDAGEATEDL